MLTSPFVLQLLVIMFLVEFVKGALLVTFLPVYLNDVLKASVTVIGWTLAVQYIGDNLLRTPIGWLIDRIGYRTSMLIGVVSTLASVLIIATASSFGWIIVSCALLGIGTAPLWPCVITGATEIAGEEGSGTVMSVVYMAWLSGVGLGPFVATYFIGSGYSTAFKLYIGLMILVVIVALFLPGRKKQKEGLRRSRDSRRTARLGLSRVQRMGLYLSEVRKSMNVSRIIFPAMFAQTFALGLLTPVLTLYATRELHLTNGQFRAFLIVGGGITVLCMIPVGKLVDRWGIKWFLNAGLVLSSAVLLVFTLVRSLPALYVLVALLGLGYALIIPSWNALLAKAIPKEKREPSGGSS
ncbi:MFS transporter [Paenibacillus sp. CC-CFT747]|nr:MFS transporter [Paenibacillus sp. CC-CFT747]